MIPGRQGIGERDLSPDTLNPLRKDIGRLPIATTPVTERTLSPMIPRRQGTHMRDRIIDAINQFTDDEGRPPTVRDICKMMNVDSTGHISYHLKRLVAEERIEHVPGSSRSLRVVGHTRSLGSNPVYRNLIQVLGTVAAGQPLMVATSTDDYIDLPVVRDNMYALRVSGTSMIGDHIQDGDVVLIESCDTVRDGEMAVLLISDAADESGSATLKRLYHESDGRLRLQPSNPDMAPMYYAPDQVRVQGRVMSVMRWC